MSCLFCIYLSVNYLTNETHRNDLIGKNHDYYKRWQSYVQEFGDDNDMVVVVRGNDRERMIHAVEAVAEEIRKDSASFDRLFYKVEAMHLRDRALLYLPSSQIRSIHDYLSSYDMTMLLEAPFNFGWKSLTFQQILEKGKAHAQNWRGDGSQPEIEGFFKQLTQICLSVETFLANPKDYRDPWLSVLPVEEKAKTGGLASMLDRPQYFFNETGNLAFVMCRPMKENDSFVAAKASIDRMRSLLDAIRPNYSDIEFGLTGLPVLENDEMLASNQDSTTASWLALLGVAILYFVNYRGFRYPMMTMTALIVGTIWALGVMTATVGHLNILSSAFAVMIIGMGDYGVLWVTRYVHDRRSGMEMLTAMEDTARHVGPSILTAAIATAFSFYAAMLANLKAVAELGWIAGSGVLLCAFSCFLLMPPLLCLFDHRLQGPPNIISLQERRESRRQWLGSWMQHPQWLIGATFALTALLCYFAVHVRYDHNLLNLQAQSLDSVKCQRMLIEETADLSWQALSWTTTPEEALALKRRYEALPEVSRVVEVASMVPLDQDRKLEMIRDIQKRLAKLPRVGERLEHALPSLRLVDKTGMLLLENLQKLGDTAPASAKALQPVLASLLSKVRGAQGRGLDQAYATRLQSYEEKLARGLADDLHQLRAVASPQKILVEDIPLALRERYIGQSGRWLVRVFGKDCLWDFEPLLNFVRRVQTVDPEATGKPFTTLEGLIAMRDGFLWAGVYAFVAMLIVLLIDFGSLRSTTIALVPLGMGVIATLGIMTLLGVPCNPANMIAFPLILGVGADNGVHVLHDYLQRDRRQPYRLGYATGRGILVSALTTILGFGTLMIAQHRGMASLGLALALGVTCCMAAALVFLPAFLGWSSQRRLGKSRRAKLVRQAA